MTTEITKRRVADQDRLIALPNYFGPQYLQYEMAVYDYMTLASNHSFKGGYWEYIVLSNGGFFMLWETKRESIRLSEPGNHFEAEFTIEAASLVANMAVCSHLAFLHEQNEFLAQNFDLLRAYAKTLTAPERKAIFGILD